MNCEDPQQLRCFCSRRPLLAVVVRDPTGKVYLHIKVHKQGRLFGEVIAEGGIVRVRCRECLRWHRVRFRHLTVDVQEETLPSVIPIEEISRS